MLTALELAKLAADMRNAQRKYFRTRGQGDLEASKRLERQLDAAIEELLRQPVLFE